MRVNQKFLQNQFSFLEAKFIKTMYQRNSEINIVYNGKTTTIEIIWESYALDKKSHITLVVTQNGIRKNLLICYDIFGDIALNNLRLQLLDKNAQDGIVLYSGFLRTNIDKL
ncbi:MAG: hypothetical protein LBU60_01985 [Clostridiales bacterium]|jgi:hypothetical protein|nr:hypothetical protein [Clostridiales bacterium]